MRAVATIAYLGLSTACLVGTSATAGEKVRLSGKAPVTDTAETGHYIRERLESRGPAILGQSSRRPSLQGVTTSPFQLPSRPTGRILTKQELDRIQAKTDWIFQGSEDAEMNEENLHRALGIRETSEGDPDSVLGEHHASALERYLQKRQEREQEMGRDAENAPVTTTELLAPATDSAMAMVGPDGQPRPGTAPDGAFDLTSPDNPADSLGLSRDTFLPSRGGSLQPFALTRPGFGDLRNLGFNQRSGLLGDSGSSSRGISDLLGSSPIESVITPNGLAVTDPINAFPDLTRQEINPVTPSVAPATTAKPLFPDTTATPSGQVVQTRRPAVANPLSAGAPSRSFLPPAPKGNSSLNPSFSPSRSIRTQLEIPRRTF